MTTAHIKWGKRDQWSNFVIEDADKRTHISQEDKWRSVLLLLPVPLRSKKKIAALQPCKNDETRQEPEWNDEGEQEIKKTSLISADTIPYSSFPCCNYYKPLQWDVLKMCLQTLLNLLSLWNNELICTRREGVVWTSSHSKIYRWHALHTSNQFNREARKAGAKERTTSPCC